MNRKVVVPQHIVEKMDPEDRKELGLKTRAEMAAGNEEKEERAIQTGVESWLRLQGYWPRSPSFLDGRIPPKGWFIHLNATKRNPILLDLLIISGGNCLELELKTASGKIRPEQKTILKSDGTALARSIIEAIETIKQWEVSNGSKGSKK